MADPNDLSPAAVAARKREHWAEVTETEFNMWRHSPMTAAYLQFMMDQVANWRELAADLIEAGAFSAGARGEDNNAEVLRGKILAFRELHAAEITTIQGFYDAATVDEDMDDQA